VKKGRRGEQVLAALAAKSSLQQHSIASGYLAHTLASHPNHGQPASPTRTCSGSINFGGAGIFGACKNIDISEINGHVTLRGEPGQLAPDGSVLRPARLVMQLEGPGAGKQQQQEQGAAAASGTARQTPLSRKSSQLGASFRRGGGEASSAPPSPLRPMPGSAAQPEEGRPLSARSAGSGRPARPPVPAAAAALQRPPLAPGPRPSAGDRVSSLRGAGADALSLPDSTVSLESAGSDQLLEAAAAAAARGSGGAVGPPPPASQAAPAATAAHRTQPNLGKEGKGKHAALRFLTRLGRKKDKYQSKERGGLLQVGRACGQLSKACTAAVAVGSWQADPCLL
jgi:hypothetical protein